MRKAGCWHERKASLEEERRFRRLIALHSLTDAWTGSILSKTEPAHRMERMTRVTLNQNLWQFEKARIDELPLNLEDLVGSQRIGDFLEELEETVWIIQGSTAENVISRTENPAETANVLQQASWNHGRSFMDAIWGGSGDLPLRDASRAFLESQLYGERAFLPERESDREVALIWKKSPLRNPALQSSEGIGLLLDLHEHFIRGCFYSLSRAVRMSAAKTELAGTACVRFSLLWSC